MSAQNIIIDTDLGDDVDDVLAIAFALMRPELAVKAITTVAFDTDKRCEIVAELLQAMGRPEVPFAPGMNLPMQAVTPERLRALMDLSGYILNHAPFITGGDSRPRAQDDAVGLMARTIEEHAGNIALVAIGPLTNVAVLLRRYPHLAAKLQWIAIMGGELQLNHCEHNLARDVVAAEIVLTAGVPLFMGTWGVTRKFVLTPEDCERIKGLGTPLGDALWRCIELWWPHKGGKPGPVMYDLAPILWSYDRRYYPTEAMQVQVETRGDHTSGMLRRGGEGMPIDVSVDMLADEVHALYMETICGAGQLPGR